MTHLFNTAPDLLEDFKQFLPESAAHAKQQAAARQAEEAAPTSNVRGDPGYPSGGTLPSQTPNRDVKMPPLGQFNVKDAKDGKKRRGPGAPSSTLGSTIPGQPGPDAARMADQQAGRPQAIQVANANKVIICNLLFLYNDLVVIWITDCVNREPRFTIISLHKVRSLLFRLPSSPRCQNPSSRLHL